jgi:hypothetical protein
MDQPLGRKKKKRKSLNNEKERWVLTHKNDLFSLKSDNFASLDIGKNPIIV